MTEMECDRMCLKREREVDSLAEEGREFHREMVDGKKEL